VISVLSAIGLAVVVFATTNVDDILLLSAFFADPAFRAPAVVVGQLVGIGVLTESAHSVGYARPVPLMGAGADRGASFQ
jgi:cadmium resistance protein CadD (predicted permease)